MNDLKFNDPHQGSQAETAAELGAEMTLETATETAARTLKSLIRPVPDFPKPGILFQDITPILTDPQSFRLLINELSRMIPSGVNKLIAIESRGFILGSALAHSLHLGLVIVRKPGKLPYKTLRLAYDLEYGQDALEIHSDALGDTDQVVIVDDVLATGGTASASEKLCATLGARVLQHIFIMEIEGLMGRSKLMAPAACLFGC